MQTKHVLCFSNPIQVEGEDADAEERQELDSDEDEHIVVLRQAEELDPEAEADFDRAFEKMMAESLDSRKFERRAQFDVPLPIRKIQRMPIEPVEEEPSAVPEAETNKMAFSLMTKRGNRSQVSSFIGGGLCMEHAVCGRPLILK